MSQAQGGWRIRDPRPEDYITKQTAVDAAESGVPCTEWQNFLETTFPLRDQSGPDFELIGFLQRWAGYCLTGLTTEQKFLFLYGTGRNGKNVFADQLFGILNDYAVRLPDLNRTARPPHRRATSGRHGRETGHSPPRRPNSFDLPAR
jgi:phage/plasmid-associated DNA primase